MFFFCSHVKVARFWVVDQRGDPFLQELAARFAAVAAPASGRSGLAGLKA
jgi:hypothetical protein